MKYIGKGFIHITKEYILKHITQLDIFSFYIPDYKINKRFCSPLRKDIHPTCNIINIDNTLYYKDFGNNCSHTCFSFVMAMYNVQYNHALQIIANDFNLISNAENHNVIIKNKDDSIRKREIDTVIKIKKRKWDNNIDRKYWFSYGITRQILNHFDVVPLSHFWVNDYMFTIRKNELSYCYIFGNNKYKLLNPYNNYKWISNCNNNIIQGYKQLSKENNKLLIITSSLKDAMLLYRYGYNAIAPQSENTLISEKDMLQIKERFTTVMVFFDNDEPGIEAAKLYNKKYNLKYKYIPIGEEKDISDYYKKYGNQKTKKMIKELWKQY